MKRNLKINLFVIIFCLGFFTGNVKAADIPDNPANTKIEQVEVGDVMQRNNGTINKNCGTVVNNLMNVRTNELGAIIQINRGCVSGNYGTIPENLGTVMSNCNIVDTNNNYVEYNIENSVVKTNNGRQYQNRGIVETNNYMISVNLGTVNVNTERGYIENYDGVIKENHGTVIYHHSVDINGSGADIKGVDQDYMIGEHDYWYLEGDTVIITAPEGQIFAATPSITSGKISKISDQEYHITEILGPCELSYVLRSDSEEVQPSPTPTITKPNPKPTPAVGSQPSSQKPAKVTGFKVKKSGHKFILSWKKVSSAKGYQMQFKKTGQKNWKNIKKVKKISKTKWETAGYVKGRKYQYRVRAYTIVKGKKVYGKWSKTVKIK